MPFLLRLRARESCFHPTLQPLPRTSPIALPSTTVMGSESEKQARGILDQAISSPQKDMPTWMRELANWVLLISAGAGKGEGK